MLPKRPSELGSYTAPPPPSAQLAVGSWAASPSHAGPENPPGCGEQHHFKGSPGEPSFSRMVLIKAEGEQVGNAASRRVAFHHQHGIRLDPPPPPALPGSPPRHRGHQH